MDVFAHVARDIIIKAAIFGANSRIVKLDIANLHLCPVVVVAVTTGAMDFVVVFAALLFCMIYAVDNFGRASERNFVWLASCWVNEIW